MTTPRLWPINKHQLRLQPIAGMPDLERWGKVAITDREHSRDGAQSYADYLGALVNVYRQPQPNENLMFGLWRKHDIVGLFMLSRSGDQSVARVTYEITPKCRGRGYATAALGALIANSSAEFGFQNYIAEIDAYNIASQKVARHAGFTLVGMSGAELHYAYRIPEVKR